MQHRPEDNLVAGAVPEASNVRFHAEGAFKAVYRAEVSGETQALKVIFMPDEGDLQDAREEIAARVSREIEALRNLTSPFVVKLGTLAPCTRRIANHDYIVYSEEFLNAPTVLELIRSREVAPFDQCRTLLRCLLEAIKQMKELRLVHRDIKPGNVVALGSAGRPFVVLDLGIAYKIGSAAITLDCPVSEGC